MACWMISHSLALRHSWMGHGKFLGAASLRSIVAVSSRSEQRAAHTFDGGIRDNEMAMHGDFTANRAVVQHSSITGVASLLILLSSVEDEACLYKSILPRQACSKVQWPCTAAGSLYGVKRASPRGILTLWHP